MNSLPAPARLLENLIRFGTIAETQMKPPRERDNKTVRKHTLHFVFLNSKSGLPHVSDFVVRDRFFKAHLKAAGVRYRGPGQCRHTYASQLLTTGIASIDWIAEQMGHTNGNMIRQHYGTWINEDGPDVGGILQHALNLQPAPPPPINRG